MRCAYNFASPKSTLRFALILNRLALGEATNVDVAWSIGCTVPALKPFIRHLVAKGEIVSSSAPFQRFRQRLPDILALAPGVVVPPMPAGLTLNMVEPDDAADITITKTWAPINFPQQNPFSALGL